jgi:hypothetical protein
MSEEGGNVEVLGVFVPEAQWCEDGECEIDECGGGKPGVFAADQASSSSAESVNVGCRCAGDIPLFRYGMEREREPLMNGGGVKSSWRREPDCSKGELACEPNNGR